MIDSLYEPFKHYSDGGSVYIFSDTHFDDEDRSVMGYTISSREQINILKRTVHKNDTLILLGDVGNPEYLLELDSYIVLILGNHDKGERNYKPYVDEIYEGPLIISPKIILSHEPLYIPYMLNIHGHDHGGYSVVEEFKEESKVYNKFRSFERNENIKGINVAANIINYYPINLKSLIKEGYLKDIKNIHRATIDRQIEKKKRG